MDQIQETQRRREELDVLVEQSPSYLVKCYECPVQTPCSHGDTVLASRAEVEAVGHTPDYRVSEVIATLEAMKKIGQSCPLLNGCDHLFSKGERRR